MDSTAPAPDPKSSDVTEAVRRLMPRLRRVGLEASAMIGVGVAIVGLGAFWLYAQGLQDKTQVDLAGFAILIGVLTAVGAHQWARKKQESLVMPVLAEAVGLTYSKDAKAFVKALPKALLPQRALHRGEDLITGQLGTHSLRMAEVKVVTGGKNSKTLFMGLVVQIPNRVPMPLIFIAPEDKTGGNRFFSNGLSTEGMVYLQPATGPAGRVYGVWGPDLSVRDDPALSAVLAVLTSIETRIGRGAGLYSALFDGDMTHVALTCRVNLFSLAGIFPTEARLLDDVRAWMDDLAVPLNLASVVIEAEAAAVAVKKGAT